MPEKLSICFIGSGAIATSLGNTLASKNNHKVTLISIENEVVESINKLHINHKYFPNIRLHPELKATTNVSCLQNADMVFLAIPSAEVVGYLKQNINYLSSKSILINLAKGFGNENKTIAESLENEFNNPVCSLKGPTFARDIVNNLPTAFTVASTNSHLFEYFDSLFADTQIYLDHSTDVIGAETASILKNIYAIALGIVDAHFNSANLRFLVLTKAFKEMRDIVLKFGGREETMFKYCGYGDFSLTALNDLSRNRTLGLLIGKGFFTNDISDKVILEGKIAVGIFHDEIVRNNSISHYPIINEMYRVFNGDYDISGFVNKILES